MLKTPSFRLENKKALVVGASSGIGQACAFALAEYGAEVLVAARRQEALEATVELIKEAGFKASSLVMDISDIANTKSLISQNGPFDILLNAAGMARHSQALETTEQDYDEVMQLNLKAAYFLSQSYRTAE